MLCLLDCHISSSLFCCQRLTPCVAEKACFSGFLFVFFLRCLLFCPVFGFVLIPACTHWSMKTFRYENVLLVSSEDTLLSAIPLSNVRVSSVKRKVNVIIKGVSNVLKWTNGFPLFPEFFLACVWVCIFLCFTFCAWFCFSSPLLTGLTYKEVQRSLCRRRLCVGTGTNMCRIRSTCSVSSSRPWRSLALCVCTTSAAPAPLHGLYAKIKQSGVWEQIIAIRLVQEAHYTTRDVQCCQAAVAIFNTSNISCSFTPLWHFFWHPFWFVSRPWKGATKTAFTFCENHACMPLVSYHDRSEATKRIVL